MKFSVPKKPLPPERQRSIQIEQNRAQCRSCMDIIESTEPHSMVYCRCGKIAIDGGKVHLLRSGDPRNLIDLAITRIS